MSFALPGLHRRRFLLASTGLAAGLAIAGESAAQGYGQAFKVDNDEGRPVANMRLPGEIVGEIPALRGVTYVGPAEAETTLYEFFDYNCPYCRKAAADMVSLSESDPSLRIGLINNPILAVQSAQAAKVALAIQRKLGSAAAWSLYRTLLAKPGKIDGPGALQAAAKLGVPAAEIESIADSEEVRLALKAQMRMAADLGLAATPSYVLGNTGLLGHPGPKALARMVAATRRCDRIAC
ncbi:disulfide bond formation protein DsbA [Methylobacterium sp. Leaf465]|uniref:DsbA family protein n=1 Tax=unclassified Methylobacterium TaxID=2615210 RepID=UPI0006F27AF2|nr:MULTISPECIES: DsbA family protein [unclassified Methylobacterium]KQT76741.1 disulfide bond formation protein DsbA [Methylobacterium sp. Leaf465]KQU33263.1 disulfide bond formation protein DsbA [Methylobacterium sp. Leaf94]